MKGLLASLVLAAVPVAADFARDAIDAQRRENNNALIRIMDDRPHGETDAERDARHRHLRMVFNMPEGS